MSAKLEYFVLFNFKSFRGKVVYGPMKDLSLIVGANGSGKSNIMDALSFAMGANARNMRVNRLRDLIHGAATGNPIGSSAYVTASFALDGDRNRIFTRTIDKDSSVYKLNGQVVSHEEYRAELKVLGIILNGRNCLVSQGTVESIAMKSPKELSEFFEELSGSIEYKQDYNRLDGELRDLRDQMHSWVVLMRSMLASKKVSLKVKKDTEAYEILYGKLIELESRSQLFELYLIKKELEALEEAEKEEAVEINQLVERKEKISAGMVKKKKEIGTLSRRLEIVDHNIQQIDDTFKSKEAHYNSVREQVVYWEAKLQTANVMVRESRAAREAHARTIQELEAEREEIERMKQEFEASVTAELSSQGSSVDLTNSQVSEYMRLKSIIQNDSLVHTRKLKALEQKQDSNQCMLDNEERKKNDIEHKLQCRKIVMEETEKRLRKLQYYIKQTEDDLDQAMKLKEDLSQQFKLFKETRVNIEAELREIRNQLKDAVYNEEAIVRRQALADTLNLLRNLGGGGKLYGRVFELCKPIHSRYQVAVAKVLGKYLDAIIVDTLDTARRCINHLKQQKIGMETFLPLDNLKVKPLKEKLRDITSVESVKLLYDVIQIPFNDISNAILFITKNTLVCDTPKAAWKVAYTLNNIGKQTCVALDGTLYRNDGIFSGGLADLSRKAKIWEENDLANLTAQQSSLQNQLREISKTLDIESNLITINTQIHGLSIRLKHSKSGVIESTETLAVVKNEIKLFSEELNYVRNSMVSINNRIKERNQNIQDIEKVINSIEDKFYADFCKKIGVRNIRQYEQRDLVRHEDQEKRRLEFAMQLDRICNMLEYEMDRDTNTPLRKKEKLVETIALALEEARQEEVAKKLKLHRKKQILQDEIDAWTAIKTDLTEQERKINEYKEEIKATSKLILGAERKHIWTLASIEEKKNTGQLLIKNSKITGTYIPLLPNCTKTSPLHLMDKSSTDSASFTEIVLIDFSKLPADLKSGNVLMNRHQLKTEIAEIQRELNRVAGPDMKIDQKLESTVKTLNEAKQKSQEVLRQLNAINAKFEQVKEKRLSTFNKCFACISDQLEQAYKTLYKDATVTALIVPANSSEPYLGGLHFHCIAPGKRWQPLDSLSGGEKTFASLAMLYVFNSFMRAPFFAFDEIDASLDDIAVNNLVNFILEKKYNIQFIIVSLGKMKYYADALCGVTTEPDSETMESLLLTLDPTVFPSPRKTSN